MPGCPAGEPASARFYIAFQECTFWLLGKTTVTISFVALTTRPLPTFRTSTEAPTGNEGYSGGSVFAGRLGLGSRPGTGSADSACSGGFKQLSQCPQWSHSISSSKYSRRIF